jgi:hypothetical protein
MVSPRLALVLDDVELGSAVTRLAALYYRSGDLSAGAETLAAAERCYCSATGCAANLHPEDVPSAERQIRLLRIAINDLTSKRFEYGRVFTPNFGPSFLHTAR